MPYTKLRRSAGLNWTRYERWNVQAKPYRLPLDRYVEDYYREDPLYPSPYGAGNPFILDYLRGEGDVYDRHHAYAYALAYDRFFGKLRNTASVGLTLLEREQSFAMILSRMKQIGKVFRHVQRAQIGRAISELGLLNRNRILLNRFITDKAAKKRAAGDVAGAFLELSFGWKPLIKDIADAIEVLQQEFNAVPVRGRGRFERDVPVSIPGEITSIKGSLGCLFYAEVSGSLLVTNPNLFFANQLGLVNLGQVLWEAVPYSFLLDQFVHINRFLGSLSNEAGCVIIEPRTTFMTRCNGSYTITQRYPGVPVHQRTVKERGYSVRRDCSSLSLPGITDRIRLPSSELFGRLLTTSALLVQQLTKPNRALNAIF